MQEFAFIGNSCNLIALRNEKMLTRRKFVAWTMVALSAIVVGASLRPSMTVGEAIQSGFITEAEAAAYLDRTALGLEPVLPSGNI